MKLPRMLRLDAGDAGAIRAHLDNGWYQVETLITYVRKFRSWNDRWYTHIRAIEERDVERCCQIARTAGGGSRLYNDVRISRSDADAVRQRSVVSILRRPNSWGLCADDVAGCVLVSFQNAAYRVELIAVDKAHQGKGYGSQLMRHLFYMTNVPVLAGTQEANAPARRMYEKLGMTEVKREVTLHKWEGVCTPA